MEIKKFTDFCNEEFKISEDSLFTDTKYKACLASYSDKPIFITADSIDEIKKKIYKAVRKNNSHFQIAEKKFMLLSLKRMAKIIRDLTYDELVFG